MGIVRPGPPEQLVLMLQMQYHLNTFVESGTYLGDTAVWASTHFDQVITIEYSPTLYREAAARHGRISNIRFVSGDSRLVLANIVATLTEPAIFWLDAHWSGGDTAGENDSCALVDEINAINQSAVRHFVLIDDARMFTSPPPLPHRIEHWPSIDEIVKELQSKTDSCYIVVFEDVIIAVPRSARETVARYCQKQNTEAWNDFQQNATRGGVISGLGHINRGLRLIASSVIARVHR
jgi:hypothetical protein